MNIPLFTVYFLPSPIDSWKAFFFDDVLGMIGFVESIDREGYRYVVQDNETGEVIDHYVV